MSIKIMNAVFERYPTGGGELVLALALADHAHDDGTHIFPYVTTLAEKTRQSDRTVQYQLRKMEASGWLQLVSHGQPGRKRSREYRISPGWIAGEEIAPFPGGPGGAEIAPLLPEKRCKPRHEKVQTSVEKGATAIAPPNEPQEPSLTVNPPNPPDDGRATGLDEGGGAGLFGDGLQPASTPKGKRRKGRAERVNLATFLAACTDSGQPAIGDDDPVYRYAAKVQLPDDLIGLAWHMFRRHHLERPRKLQADWRATFRNYVEHNYLKLWLTDGGGYRLSTVGQQELRLMNADREDDTA